MDYSGILLIDKPEGITSHKVCEIIKKKFNFKKVGHSGTLDPFATGLLILGINRCTRLLKYLTEFPKEYNGTIFLGEKKDSFDITGNTIDKKEVNVSEKEILETAKEFIGTIKQKPPLFSALKKNGKPLYKYARAGKKVDVNERFVFIEKFEIMDINLPEIKFSIRCSKGTYIRSIANDFAEKLNTYGFLKELRRTAINNYSVNEAKSIENISLNDLIPFENAMNIKKLFIKDEFNELLENGSFITKEFFEDCNFVLNNNEYVYVFGKNCIVLGYFIKEKDMIKPEIVYKKSLH